jgi:SAM-dependent methyltransferase
MPRRVCDNKDPLWQVTPPSSTLLKFEHALRAITSHPVLDAGCGHGRNSIALALRGLDVVCADSELNCLSTLTRLAPVAFNKYKMPSQTIGRLQPVCVNLNSSDWPFIANAFSTVVCVHFLKLDLLPAIHSSTLSGGLLYIETFGGHGQNYLDLPRKGQLKSTLSASHDLLFYRERPVGPSHFQAASVKLLARKL